MEGSPAEGHEGNAGGQVEQQWVERSDEDLVPPRQEPLTAPSWFTGRTDRARARREQRARERERRRAEKLFDEQMHELAWLTRSLDFDSGLAALSLELIARSDVPVIEADVLRGYDEYADALVRLRERISSAADLPEPYAAGVHADVSRWYGMGEVIGEHLHACDGRIRDTIRAQLAADQAWLDQLRPQHR